MREGVYANRRLCDFRGESSLLANYCTNANKSVLIYDRLIHFATAVTKTVGLGQDSGLRSLRKSLLAIDDGRVVLEQSYIVVL